MDSLMTKRWPFFYQLVLSYLDFFREKILQETDMTNVLLIIQS
jgi:hypothetical protein